MKLLIRAWLKIRARLLSNLRVGLWLKLRARVLLRLRLGVQLKLRVGIWLKLWASEDAVGTHSSILKHRVGHFAMNIRLAEKSFNEKYKMLPYNSSAWRARLQHNH